MSLSQPLTARGVQELNKPELAAALRPIFTALSVAGIEHPVAYGLGVSELDRGLTPAALDMVALQPEHGLRRAMQSLMEQNLTPRFSSGAGQVTQLHLHFQNFDVALRLREGLVYDTPTAENPKHKTMVPLGASEMALLSNTPAYQIAVDATGCVKATRAYLEARTDRAAVEQIMRRAFA